MSNKKEKTIEAYERLISVYQEPPPGYTFYTGLCPLCKIHIRSRCLGCPNRSEHVARCDVSNSPTLEKVASLNLSYIDIPEIRLARAKAIKQIIEIIKDLPASRFTKRGWKYFSEIEGL